MARKPRIEFEGAFYHIIVRGNQGQDIFLIKPTAAITLAPSQIQKQVRFYSLRLCAHRLAITFTS